ncbi:MFS transporter [Phlyctema vagabunda]|uniref:MFS transporter n=1 Tax=Phlyctema vagabunda TaxID=108571 RepID=A0ABR4PRW8_9HELO
MSTTTTTIVKPASVTKLSVSADQFRAIELEPIGFSAPTEGTPVQKRQDESGAQPTHDASDLSTENTVPEISKWKTMIIIGTVASVTLINSMLAGILTVALPTMARDLNLSEGLILWPASVSSLACGCTLLLSGSIADVVGGRTLYLSGAFLLTITTLACGLSKTGLQLILFRAAQGVALSLTLPSSVKLITSNIATGTSRNIAFASLGAAFPVGATVGLVMGGLFVQSIGWQYGYYIGAVLTFVVFIISIFGIPAERKLVKQDARIILQRLKSEIDWIGIALLSTSLGMYSYVLSVLASDTAKFVTPASLAIFSVGTSLFIAFAFYSRRQEKLGRKVVIPPSIWRNPVFTSLCITVFFMWGAFNAVPYFLTLYFQSVQGISGLQTSIRFLPMVFSGIATNVLTGWLVKRVRADIMLLGSTVLSAISPLLMAIIQPEWSYWRCAFIAVLFAPISIDVLYTIANLVITSIFPPKTHGLAGGVFSTLSNFGNSFGLAITAVIASSITLAKHGKDESEAEKLMAGYRATFWFCFGAYLLVLCIVGFGLRKIGKVGIKQE